VVVPSPPDVSFPGCTIFFSDFEFRRPAFDPPSLVVWLRWTQRRYSSPPPFVFSVRNCPACGVAFPPLLARTWFCSPPTMIGDPIPHWAVVAKGSPFSFFSAPLLYRFKQEVSGPRFLFSISKPNVTRHFDVPPLFGPHFA